MVLARIPRLVFLSGVTDPVAAHFLKDLAIILSLAALVTVVFQRLHLPLVPGYLAAGVVVGPEIARGLISDPATIRALAEIGVVLVMFFVGLEFRVRRVARLAPRLGLAVLIEISLMLVLGFGAATLLGWGELESLLAAGVVAISSTAVIAKSFEETAPEWRLRDLVFSLVVLEDVVAIVLVAVLTTMAFGSAVDVGSLGGLLGRLAVLLAAMVVVGLLTVPPVIRAVVALGRSETILITAVGLTFLFALITHTAGYSVALGAFLAGVLMAESGVGHQVTQIVQPVRDLFAAVFFVAVGMLLDPAAAVGEWRTVLLFVVVVIVGKVVGVSVGAFLAGFGTRTSVQAAMSMAQIGEFSFIIAGLGLAGQTGGRALYSVAVATALVTAFLTPVLIRRSEAAAWWLDRRLPRRIQTFTSLYTAWVETLSVGPGEARDRGPRRRMLAWLALDAALVAAALIGASFQLTRDAGWLDWLGVSARVERPLILTVAAAAALIFGAGMARTARRLARMVAESVVPSVAAGLVDQGRAPRRALEITVEIALTIAVGIPLVLVTLPFLPAFGVPVMVGAVLVLLGFAFWRTAWDLDSHTRAGAELVAHVLARQGAGGAGSLDQVRDMLPGLGELSPMRVEAGSAIAGKTLGDLNIRGRTGATIVAVAREGGTRLVFPTAGDRLEQGDLIAVTGSHQAILAAEALAQGNDARPEPA